jgi:hypothetical protein
LDGWFKDNLIADYLALVNLLGGAIEEGLTISLCEAPSAKSGSVDRLQILSAPAIRGNIVGQHRVSVVPMPGVEDTRHEDERRCRPERKGISPGRKLNVIFAQ